ncbi:MAG: hypothetical protein J6W82_12200, partial [Bacteroidales bacterium]|nr:hypothetical protein [Bacteroidales bacterium]
VGTKTYNTADMLELALRSYLFIRGYDGADTKNYGAGKIAALDGGAKAMSETVVPDTHEYKWGANPYNETGTYDVATGATTSNGGHFIKIVDGAAVHCQTDPTLLDNWAMRALNYSSGNPISNMCTYPRDPFNNYAGSFSSMRALITYAFFFKYMLDNNLDKADGLDATVNIRTELFGDEGYVEPAKPTIKDFANEFVKILDVWQNNTATVKMHPDAAESVENAHIIPEGTTIKVGDKTYNTADMYETAARSYLLLRGYDGLDTEKYGNKSIPALADGAKKMSETDVPETHGYTWGSAPSNELGTYDIATGEKTSNGGHLIKIVDGKAVHCQVDVVILDNQVMRSLNYAHGKDISNMCTYPRADHNITNYAGSFSATRGLITYAFFFKYMLDNNLEKADGITEDVVIRSELFGDEGEPEPQPVITIADVANEYVKIIDKWMETVGDKKMHSSVDATKNAHYIPDDFTITVKDATGKVEKTYNTADMFETALRSYLLIRGYNGLDTENYGAGKIAALDGGALSMSETPVPETHGYTWGEAPCNETSGNGGNFAMIGPQNFKVYNVAKLDVLDNWAMRSLNFQHGKSITNLCGYANGQLAGYYGCFSSMRALITYAFFFKYMISKKYDKGTDMTADETVRSELFGVDGQQLARWVFSAADAGKEGAYGSTFGGDAAYTDAGVYNGNSYLYKPEAGDGGQYAAANWNGDGRITFVQIDKTSMSGNTNAGHQVGSTGHIVTKGNWPGDYWLFTATSASELPANTKIHVKYIFRSSASGPGYFLVEYLDGSEWKPCSLQEDTGAQGGGNVQFAFPEVQTVTIGSEEIRYNARARADGSTNTTVETVFNLTNPTTTVKLRATVAGAARADGKTTPTALNGGTTRICGSTPNPNGAFTSPIIEIAQFKE